MWRLVEQLAQQVCGQPESRDGYELERIADELSDAVQAIRRDQHRFLAEFRSLADSVQRDEWSVKAPPALRLVTENEFEEMAYPRGRESA